MSFNIAIVLYVTIFATMYISREAFGSDLRCYSCFGYDKDGHDKCHTLETENYNHKIITCTTNTTCIRYTATYEIPQMMGNKMKAVPATVHGLYCGTHEKCDMNDCPNFWPKDIVAKECDVKCCNPRKQNKDKCSFPVPEQDKDGERSGVSGVSAKAGARGSESGVARVSQSMWLQAVSVAILGLFKL